jgi:hypothetical protein
MFSVQYASKLGGVGVVGSVFVQEGCGPVHMAYLNSSLEVCVCLCESRDSVVRCSNEQCGQQSLYVLYVSGAASQILWFMLGGLMNCCRLAWFGHHCSSLCRRQLTQHPAYIVGLTQ